MSTYEDILDDVAGDAMVDRCLERHYYGPVEDCPHCEVRSSTWTCDACGAVSEEPAYGQARVWYGSDDAKCQHTDRESVCDGHGLTPSYYTERD